MYPEQRGTRQEVEKYYGKYAGVVLAHDELPDDAAERGQIRVQVPGILEEDPAGGDDRPIEVIARPNFLPGFFFIPEEEAQVWVEFVAGDINFPIWTGVWYPDDGAPETVDGEGPTRFQKIIRTASGHVMELDDSEGDEAVTVLHTIGAQIKIDKNGSVLIANQKGTFLFVNAEQGETTLFDQHKNLLTMTKDAVVVSGKDGASVQITEGIVALSAKNKIHLTAKDIVLEGGTVTLGKDAQSPAVLGDILSQVLIAHTHPSAMGPTGPATFIIPLGTMPPGPGMALSGNVKVK